jgi:hypothetical protein
MTKITESKVVSSYIGDDAVSAPMAATDTVAKKVGRPTKYNANIGAEICSRLASGEPITKITKDEHMPASATLYRWLASDAEFREMYEISRRDGAHTFAAQIVEIIDDEPMYVFDDKGNKRVDPGSIAQKRLKMDGRKWIAAKYLPKVYGDRTVLQGDADADAVQLDVNIFDEMIKNLELKRQVK